MMRKTYPLVLLVLCVSILGALYYATKPAPRTSGDSSEPFATTTPQTDATSTKVVEEVVDTKPKEVDPHANEVKLRAYTTAYTYYDNTPPGSAIIAFRKSDGFPTVHDVAGGLGTYADPITIAVGHVLENGVDTPDFAPGTRFYLPNLRKYFIVEDTCGDGNRPQDIPCHKLNQEASLTGATVWLDLWIGGNDATQEEAQVCASQVTEAFTVIQNPVATYVVVPGAVITAGICAKQYGDKAIEQ